MSQTDEVVLEEQDQDQQNIYYNRRRCRWPQFLAVVTHEDVGGSEAWAAWLWHWVVADKKTRPGVRSVSDEFLSWGHLLLIAEGEPSVELSGNGGWEILVRAINMITAVE